MALDTELRRIAEAAVAFSAEEEELAGIVPTEPAGGVRAYVCAYRAGEEPTSWLVLDEEGAPVANRSVVRDAVSIAGLCELADEAAGLDPEDGPRVATPAHLDELGARSVDRGGFVEAMKQATATVEELARDVERGYKLPLR